MTASDKLSFCISCGKCVCRLKSQLTFVTVFFFKFSIFPSADQENTTTLIPAAHNTGGSLPDLTNIHFPSPLPTPLDPEESTFPSLSSSNSTGNLAANLTHLGISTASQGKNISKGRIYRLSVSKKSLSIPQQFCSIAEQLLCFISKLASLVYVTRINHFGIKKCVNSHN